MFKVKKIITIDQDEDKYLSFPDIIQSIKKPSRYFLVYREGNNHHPVVSKLILKKSENYGKTWKTQQEFILNIEDDKYVWNCPRLSYINNILYIVCDAKSGTFERQAHFKTVFLTSTTEGEFFRYADTPLPGMVPDKIISFKGTYYCANHKIKNTKNELIQLVSWSRDGKVWYDTNIIANHQKRQYCEASIVNINDDYMIAYLRDNGGHKRYVYTTKSRDGVHWNTPYRLSIFGQRITALKYNNKPSRYKQIINRFVNHDCVVGAYRNTKNCNVSMFHHNLKTNKINSYDIDEEYKHNQYNYGYTGLAEGKNEYLLTYYIKKETDNPYINLAFVEKN